MRLACLVLAAGGGTRFGGRKQLAPVHGRPMIQYTLEQLKPLFGDHLFTVLGAYRQEIGPVISGHSRIIEHEDWRAGIGSSIARGVRGITRQSVYDGILIALSDQIGVNQPHYRNLIGKFTGNSIVAACYDNNPAAPAMFPAACFEQLQQLSGDIGAQKILRDSANRVITIPLPEAAADIDYREDFINYQLK